MFNYIKNGSLIIVCPKSKWTGKVDANCQVFMSVRPNYTRWKLQRMTNCNRSSEWEEFNQLWDYTFSYDWAGVQSVSMSKRNINERLVKVVENYVVVTDAGNIFESVNKLVNKV